MCCYNGTILLQGWYIGQDLALEAGSWQYWNPIYHPCVFMFTLGNMPPCIYKVISAHRPPLLYIMLKYHTTLGILEKMPCAAGGTLGAVILSQDPFVGRGILCHNTSVILTWVWQFAWMTKSWDIGNPQMYLPISFLWDSDLECFFKVCLVMVYHMLRYLATRNCVNIATGRVT